MKQILTSRIFIAISTVLITSLGWQMATGVRRGADELWLISAVKAPGRMALDEIQSDLSAGRSALAARKVDAFEKHWLAFDRQNGFRGTGIGDIMSVFAGITNGVDGVAVGGDAFNAHTMPPKETNQAARAQGQRP